MKMKTLYTAIVALIMTASLAACGETKPEELSFITGSVVEKETKAPVPGITIYFGDQSVTTTSDGRYIIAKLEKGSTHTISCINPKYKDFKLENVVAVYPSSTHDIELEIKVPETPTIPPITSISVKQLKSFDYILNYGVDANQITSEVNGSFSAPSSYTMDMKQFRQQQIQVGPEDKKTETPTIKLTEINGKQWIDEGKGYSEVPKDQTRNGFKEMFGMIDYNCSVLTKALAQVKNLTDEGVSQIGGVECRRFKGVVVFDIDRVVNTEKGRGTVKDKVLCDFNIAVATDEKLNNAPVDGEILLYYKDLMVRTYTHFTLSNFNNPIVIKAPEVKGPSNKIEIKNNP
jgi:hypothetical protein